MKIEKAIKFFDDEILMLNNAPKLNGCEMTEEWKEQLEICKMAKSAIEKRIPKKVKVEQFNRYNIYYCPICDGYIGDSFGHIGDGFCSSCGQALDWSDLE